VTSEPAAGTAFTIGLPRCHEGPCEADQDLSMSLAGDETVLLVEDEPSILKMGRRMLTDLGYRVLAAATPAEAISQAHARADAIDLLVSDVVMPEMNGHELARRLSARYPAMKRLFMSGYPADVIAHQGILEPGVHFLQKPFTVAAFSQKVREALDQ
jgi:CheY-like chemotaxis protein